MNISIIGSGWVGTLLGKSLLKKGNNVIFFDVLEKRIAELKKEKLDATLDINYALRNSETSFLTVPTPEKNEKIDLTYIEKASETLGKALKDKKSYHLIVVKSTVVPGTTETLIKNTIEKNSSKKAGKEFGLCMNPEFLTQIHNSWTKDSSYQRTPDSEERIVIGEYDKKSGDLLEKLYKGFGIPIFRVDLKTAEFTKYASNCCLASKISFWNEFFLVSKKLGIDSEKVAELVSIDKRIGKYGTVHGKAFGGTCLEKDLKAFTSFLKSEDIESNILKSVLDVNSYMKKKYGTRE